jgi:hypothetical protein
LYEVFYLFNNIRTKHLPLANLIPIQWSPALPTIQGLERRFLQTGLIAVVV